MTDTNIEQIHMTVGQVTVDMAAVDGTTPAGAAYYLRSLKDIRGLVNGIDSGSGDDTRGLVATLVTVLDALRNVEGFVIREDELIEITPNHMRLRKRHLDPHERKRAAQARKQEA